MYGLNKHIDLERRKHLFEVWPIFVISLCDAEDRRAKISRQLNYLGLPFEIVDATDGRRGLTTGQESLVDRPGTLAHLGRRMTDSEYACALSHLGVWKRIIESDLPGAVVLEDDAVLDRPFADFMKAREYDTAPLVLLDHERARTWYWTRPIRGPHGRNFIPIVGNAERTTGYSISSQGAAYLDAHSLPLQRPADWPCDITALKPLAALPRLVDRPEDEADSTIASERDILFSAKRNRVKLRKERIFRKFRSRWWHKKFVRHFTYRIS